MKISTHSVDWCHLCGNTHNELLDVWYPENAQNDNLDTEYIRICGSCVGEFQKVLEEGG